MKLSALLQSAGLPPVLADPEISSLSYDSRTAKPGSLFFALPGGKLDGMGFARDAVALGAVAVVGAGDPGDLGAPVVQV
jgi:UDP-N-acetylmuramoyl-L-alanyl-D-glutamate--2,6-diaminopimelate ligase